MDYSIIIGKYYPFFKFDLEDPFMKHKLFNLIMVLVMMLTLTSTGFAQQGSLTVVSSPQAEFDLFCRCRERYSSCKTRNLTASGGAGSS